jgi:hypothetical protein
MSNHEQLDRLAEKIRTLGGEDLALMVAMAVVELQVVHNFKVEKLEEACPSYRAPSCSDYSADEASPFQAESED